MKDLIEELRECIQRNDRAPGSLLTLMVKAGHTLGEQAREIESLTQERDSQQRVCIRAMEELAALKAKPSGVVPDWLTSSRAFADRLYAAGWRDHADAQHAGVAGMYDELLSAAPSAGSQKEQG